MNLSDRRTCRVLNLARSTARYRSRKREDPLLGEILTLSEKWRGCGYRRVYDEMRKKGHRINHKKVERLFRELKLGVKRKRKRLRIQAVKSEGPVITQRNEMWAMDFLFDRLTNGREYRMLTLIDIHTRECLRIEVRRSLTSRQVIEVLDRVAAVHGLPDAIRVDNGPEFISHALRSWAENNGVQLAFTDPGCPTQNGHIESFNGTLRAECLGLWAMDTLNEVTEVVEEWRRRYNLERTHFEIGRTPAEFAQHASSRPFRALSTNRTKYRPDGKAENKKAVFHFPTGPAANTVEINL